MRKKVFIAGAMLALIILIGSTTAFAQGATRPDKHAAYSSAWMSELAAKLHLSADDIAAIRSEIASGKPIKDVLESHGITLEQLRDAFGSTLAGDGHRMSNTEIANLAAKLGLDAGEVEQEIASGKTFRQIMQERQISRDRLEAVLGADHHHHPAKGKFRKK